LLGIFTAVAGCKTAVFTCASDEQCGGGWCEVTGYCSFEDAECPSGRRYGSLGSRELSNACVAPVSEPSADDGIDDSGTTSGATWTPTSDAPDSTSGLASSGFESSGLAGTTGDTTSADDPSSDTTGVPVGVDCRIGFEDDFEGEVLDEIWVPWTAGDPSEIVQANGVVTFTLPPTESSWVALNYMFDSFTGHAIIFEVAAASSDPNAYPWVEVTGPTKYELGVDGGDTLLVRAGESADPEILEEFPFDPVEHRFWRLGAGTDEVQWAVSSNGQSWVVLHTAPAPAADLLAEHRAAFGLGTRVDLPSGAQASFDRFVRCP
jgi:hypothetical protein